MCCHSLRRASIHTHIDTVNVHSTYTWKTSINIFTTCTLTGSSHIQLTNTKNFYSIKYFLCFIWSFSLPSTVVFYPHPCFLVVICPQIYTLIWALRFYLVLFVHQRLILNSLDRAGCNTTSNVLKYIQCVTSIHCWSALSRDLMLFRAWI